MRKRIAIIQGHPDTRDSHYCHALAEAYASGARGEGHEVLFVNVAQLEFSLLRTQERFRNEPPPDCIRDAQSTINWADHLVFFYPLWLGTLPAKNDAVIETIGSTAHEELIKVDEALRRLDSGHYGICDSCGHPIEAARLEAVPYAVRCVGCSSQPERSTDGKAPAGRESA